MKLLKLINKRRLSKVLSLGKPTKKYLYNFLTRNKFLHLTKRVYSNTPTESVAVRFNQAPRNKLIKKIIHFGSYNYAGLNGHSDIIKQAKKALDQYGSSTSGVRLLNGTNELHLELENTLADFLEYEEVVTYNSGYVANLSLLQTICSSNDVVFSDEYNHQSIFDGLTLAKTNVVKFSHCDYENLEKLMAQYPETTKKFIITDGIFSMDGDVADLPKIVSLAKKFNAVTIVDDAHATSAFGPYGKGTPHHFNVQNEIDIITGSLSKGLPGSGGFVACNKELAILLRYASNGYIFSASSPPATAAGLIEAIRILKKEPQRQERIKRNSEHIRQGLQEMGFDTMNSTTAIIPILLHDAKLAFKLAGEAHSRGLYLNAICFPAVARQAARIRVNANAALRTEDITKGLEIIKASAKALKIL